MSLQSTFTSASINGWRGLSSSIPFELNNVIINDLPRSVGQGFGYICAVSNNGEYFACSSYSGGGGTYPDAYIWIFKNNFDGTYTQQATYTYTLHIVRSLSISDAGDYVAVTAGPLSSAPSPLTVYRRTGSTWTAVSVVTPSSFNFGVTSKISGDGNYVVVSGRSSTGPQCIFMFARSGSSWNLVQTITLVPSSSTYTIGAVSINYDGSYVGVTNRSGTGSLFVYYKASTTWALQQQIPLNGYTGQAGTSLSINNDATSLIFNNVSAVLTSSATIYNRIGTTWSFDITLQGSSTTDQFGTSVRVAGTGNTYVISSPAYDYPGYTNSGVIQVFEKTNTGYSMIQRLYTSQLYSNQGFTGASGLDIDTSGQWIIGGAPDSAIYGGTRGAAFLYSNA